MAGDWNSLLQVNNGPARRLRIRRAVAFLFLGVNSMAHGGEYDRVHATRYMVLRVAAQGAALALPAAGDAAGHGALITPQGVK